MPGSANEWRGYHGVDERMKCKWIGVGRGADCMEWGECVDWRDLVVWRENLDLSG